MMKVTRRIEEPLFKYREYQTSIANNIKLIGGAGKIHGCIIDIDYYNHIYVDPFNSSITPYYALSMTNKTVYSTLEKLLEKRNKALYMNYKKLILDSCFPQEINTVSVLSCDEEFNSSTSMYKASKEILKLQRLTNKTLTIWIDPVADKKLETQ